MVDVTDLVETFCSSDGRDGIVNVFVPHATAGVALMETGSGSRPIWRSCSSACCRATIDTGTVTARPVTAVITSCPFWWPRPCRSRCTPDDSSSARWQRVVVRGPEPGERRAAPAAHVRTRLSAARMIGGARVQARLPLLAVRGRRDRLHVALAQEETVPPVQLDLQTRLRQVESDRPPSPSGRPVRRGAPPPRRIALEPAWPSPGSAARRGRSARRCRGFPRRFGRRSIGCPRPWSRARAFSAASRCGTARISTPRASRDCSGGAASGRVAERPRRVACLR